MRKKLISLISAIVALCLVLGIYFIFGNKSPDEGKGDTATTGPVTTPTPESIIYDLKLEDSKYITIENKNEEPFTMEYQRVLEGTDYRNVFLLLGDNTEGFDATEVSTIFQVMIELKGREVDPSIVEDAQDAEFGFDLPTVVTLEMTDGTKNVLEIGDNTSTTSGMYVRKRGEKKVYIISYGEGLYLKSSVNDIKSLTIFTAGSEEFIQKIIMRQKGEFQYTLEGTESETDEYGDWYITEPAYWKILPESNFYVYLNQFYSIKAEECVDTTGKTAEYGLDVPDYEMEFYIGNTKHIIALGDLTEDGAYFYGRWNNGNDIYKIPVGNFPSIDKTLKDMVEQLVYKPPYYNLSKLVLEFKGKEYSIEIDAQTDDRDKDIVVYNKKKINKTDHYEAFTSFQYVYMASIGFLAEDFDFEAKPELKDPEIRVTFYNRADNETVTLEYVKREDGVRYYIFMDGKYTGGMALVSIIDEPMNEMRPGLIAALDRLDSEFNKIKT